ncbi:alpha/beta hydrolase [Candidatus Thorarchaeota archaeon]|nr:MAG: alpha/beta hydrolase [Candidatus Thorarchaeota archaeon]
MKNDTHHVELQNGIIMPFVEMGSSDGVPLLLIHGYTGSWHVFKPLLRHLPESIHAFAITLRGHGNASRPPVGYTLQDFAGDVLKFMDEMSIERAVLVGGSSGGLVARRVAIGNPKRILGLVFLGSPSSLKDNKEIREIWDETISKLTDPVDPSFVREFIEGVVNDTATKGYVKDMIQTSLHVPARVWKDTMIGFMNDDSFDRLGEITAPSLVIWGDRDSVLSRQDQEALAAALPDARLLVYDDASHLFYFQEPERTASDLANFVSLLIK